MWKNTKGASLPLLGVLLMATLVAVVGLGRAQRSPRLYRIGLVAPFEGLYRQTGYAALDVLRAQVQEWNQGAAATGIQLQVWAVDDGNDPEQAVLRAEELAADPLILAVVGHLTPETSAAAAPIYRRAGLLQVSPVTPATMTPPGEGGLIVSLGPDPSRLIEILAAGGAGPGPLPALGKPLWPLSPSLGPNREGVAIPWLNTSLAVAIRYLYSASVPPERLALPYGYCPEALPAMCPRTSLYFLAPEGATDTHLEALISEAGRLALDSVLPAETADAITREELVHRTLARLGERHWQQHDSVWYPDTSHLTLLPYHGLHPRSLAAPQLSTRLGVFASLRETVSPVRRRDDPVLP